MDPEKLNSLKRELRSLIVSCPSNGMTIQQLMADYEETIGCRLPYAELGFQSPLMLFSYLRDVFMIKNIYGDPLLFPVVTESVRHINAFVVGQKKTRKPPGRRPRYRQCSNFTICPPDELEDDDISFPFYQEKSGGASRSLEKEDHSVQKGPASFGRVSESVNELRESNGCSDWYPKCSNESFRDLTSPTHSEGVSPTRSKKIRSIDLKAEQVPDKVRMTFQRILSQHPEGLSISAFCSKYKELYNEPLDYKCWGFESVREIILALSDVFLHDVTPSDEWLLFDAKICRESPEAPSIKKWIPIEVLEKFGSLSREYPEGIPFDRALEIYKETYGTVIDVRKLGFISTTAFLLAMSSIDSKPHGCSFMIVPKRLPKLTVKEKFALALPSNSDIYRLKKSYFREDVCDPSIHYKPLSFHKNSRGDFLSVVLGDSISPDEMWFQLFNDLHNLQKLMDDLQQFCENADTSYFMDPLAVVPGQVCAARFFKDQMWHRGEIVSYMSQEKVEVLYVDYGNINIVHISELRYLPKKFAEPPLFSFCTYLCDALVPVGLEKWPSKTCNLLYDLTFSKALVAEVVEVDLETPSLGINLFDTSGDEDVCINDMLISKDLAIRGRKSRPTFSRNIRKMERDEENNILFKNSFNKGSVLSLNEDTPIPNRPEEVKPVPPTKITNTETPSPPKGSMNYPPYRNQGGPIRPPPGFERVRPVIPPVFVPYQIPQPQNGLGNYLPLPQPPMFPWPQMRDFGPRNFQEMNRFPPVMTYWNQGAPLFYPPPMFNPFVDYNCYYPPESYMRYSRPPAYHQGLRRSPVRGGGTGRSSQSPPEKNTFPSSSPEIVKEVPDQKNNGAPDKNDFSEEACEISRLVLESPAADEKTEEPVETKKETIETSEEPTLQLKDSSMNISQDISPQNQTPTILERLETSIIPKDLSPEGSSTPSSSNPARFTPDPEVSQMELAKNVTIYHSKPTIRHVLLAKVHGTFLHIMRVGSCLVLSKEELLHHFTNISSESVLRHRLGKCSSLIHYMEVDRFSHWELFTDLERVHFVEEDNRSIFCLSLKDSCKFIRTASPAPDLWDCFQVLMENEKLIYSLLPSNRK